MGLYIRAVCDSCPRSVHVTALPSHDFGNDAIETLEDWGWSVYAEDDAVYCPACSQKRIDDGSIAVSLA